MVETLLQVGADVDKESADGFKPLDAAVINRHTAVATLLRAV